MWHIPWPVMLFLVVVLGTFAWGGVLAAPWVPIFHADVDRLLAVAKPRVGEMLCDLGCGDGRILVRSARRFGTRSIGYEVSLLPYVLCWGRILSSGLWSSVRVRYKNFYRQSLREANIVTAFLTPRAMEKLGPKLAAELRPGSRVVSYAFPIPGWNPATVDKPTPQSMAIYGYVMAQPTIPLPGRQNDPVPFAAVVR